MSISYPQWALVAVSFDTGVERVEALRWDYDKALSEAVTFNRANPGDAGMMTVRRVTELGLTSQLEEPA